MRNILLMLILLVCVTLVSAEAASLQTSLASGSYGTVWQSASTVKIMRDTPSPAKKDPGIKVSAAKNEYEAFQIVLRPTKQLDNVTVTAHTLTGPKGAKLDAWNISVRNVGYVQITEPTDKNLPGGSYPDPLPVFTPFTAPAGQNSPVWVTVYVPDKTTAGDYKGTIDVTAKGMPKVAVPITVHVWNFALPTVSKLRTAYGCGLSGPVTYHGATTLEQKRKLTDIYNKEFWRHRISPYTPYAFYDIKTTLENGKLSLDFTDFDQAVKKYFPMFNSYNLPNFGMGDSVGHDFGDSYEQLKIEYMRAVTEHLVDLGQIEKGYNYITDEPNEGQYQSVVDAADLCRKADARIKVLLTEQVEPKLIESVDIWVPIMDQYNEEKCKARQAKGEEIWWYVCCWPRTPFPNNFIDYTALDNRVLPWITWHYSINGILYWSATYWNDNPYEHPMSISPDGKDHWGNGDGSLLYPPVRKPSETFVDKPPVPSIRWEMIREGVEDYDYFRILKDKLSKAKKSGASGAPVTKAEDALKQVDSCVTSATDFCRDPNQLMTVRAKVAEAIEGLGK